MIIRSAQPGHDEGEGAATFLRIDILALTSQELRDRHKVRLADFGAQGAAELEELLAGAAPDLPLRADRVMRVFARCKVQMPCFLAWQDSGEGELPLLVDGPPGRWSLFFERNGAMTLVRREGERLKATPHEELDPFWRPKALNPAGERLRRGMASIRQKMFRRGQASPPPPPPG